MSILIPTCGAYDHVRVCIESLRRLTTYDDYEIVVIDNISVERTAIKAWVAIAADRVIDMPGEFNWSRFNNRAAEASGGNFLLFLNDDVEVIEPGWLDALLEHAQQPEIGAVGARLLYPDRSVQHAGMFLAAPGIARHAFRFMAEDELGYFGLAQTQRNVIAVTGACLMVRREVFDRVGQFDETHAIVANDLDFCLRLHAAGMRVVYTPHATLLHHERASREAIPDLFDAGRFDRRWNTMFAAGDPYFSPHLAQWTDDYQPDEEPVTAVFTGKLFRREEIRRILLMKVDHIGDFVTALPAMRRVRELFPHAALTVLTAPAVRHLVPPEIGIESFIGMQFFNARSELGRDTVGEAELQAMGRMLSARRFDLAVDLRKHGDSRDLLQRTGARLLAGFDTEGQFPFLDVAVEWAADRALQRKRSHVEYDLLNLVETIGNAAIDLPGHSAAAEWSPERPPAFLSAKALRLWRRPIVAVHPGAGNTIKQWSAAHFAALIDLLLEHDGVNILLVGNSGERKLAADLRLQVAQKDRVLSLAGAVGLDVLPALLASCVLFIGNDSGPKHIAASLGVPTIGIHAGTVDPAEWAPAGRRAVAMWRAMTCSPCYLARAGDCPRGVACMTQLEPALVHRMAQRFMAQPAPR